MASETFEFKELEPHFMAAFLVDRKMWVQFKDHIRPSFFENKHISVIFQIWKKFFEERYDFPTKDQTVYFIRKLSNNEDTIKTALSIYQVDSIRVSDVEFFHTETARFIRIKKAEEAIFNVAAQIQDGKWGHNDEKWDDAIAYLNQELIWRADINLGTELSDARIRYESLRELIFNVVPSPWDSLNALICGGFYKKELTLFAASSSVGKSIALDQIALFCWKVLGLDVVLISGELSEERKGQRIDACQFGIPVHEVFNNRKTIIKWYEDNRMQNRLFIKEFPTNKASARNIEDYLYMLRLYKGLKKPGILLIDYMDIFRPIGKITGDPYKDQGTVGENFRALAQEWEMPTVSATQFGRSSVELEIDEINETNLADSWKKMMISDTLIAMASNSEQRANGKIFFKLCKNRNGEKDKIFGMNIIYEQLKIVDPKMEADAQLMKQASQAVIDLKERLKQEREEDVDENLEK